MYRSSLPTLACPQCAVGLALVPANPTLYACVRCGGAWVDAESSMAVLQGKSDPSDVQRRSRPPAPKPTRAPEVPRPCARCSETMLPYPFGDVTLDTCPAHGTWFDHDEIARVVKAARKMQARAGGESTGLPTAGDVWATAKFGLGVLVVPFAELLRVFADAERERRREGHFLDDD